MVPVDADGVRDALQRREVHVERERGDLLPLAGGPSSASPTKKMRNSCVAGVAAVHESAPRSLTRVPSTPNVSISVQLRSGSWMIWHWTFAMHAALAVEPSQAKGVTCSTGEDSVCADGAAGGAEAGASFGEAGVGSTAAAGSTGGSSAPRQPTRRRARSIRPARTIRVDAERGFKRSLSIVFASPELHTHGGSHAHVHAWRARAGSVDPEAFARSWLGAFDAQDPDVPAGTPSPRAVARRLDAIMAHYAEQVEHSSPTVVRVLGEPSGIVRGKAALRAYFEKALAAAPADLHYELLRLHVGVDGVTLVYHRTGGKIVAETFHFDKAGLVVRAFVAHAEPPEGPRVLRNRFVLAVPNVRASADFFCRALGFRVVNEPPGWIFVARDECTIMLGECPDAIPARELGDHSYFGYLLVDDADALYAAASASAPGAIGRVEDKPWGMREFTVRTPDGHRLMVGQVIR